MLMLDIDLYNINLDLEYYDICREHTMGRRVPSHVPGQY